MKLSIDLQQIYNISELDLNEYIYLHLLYINTKASLSYIKTLGEINYLRLQKLGYVKFDQENVSCILREKAIRLFKVDADMFKDFYNLYPHKTPSGRPLRTESVNTTRANTVAKLFKRIFGNKPEAIERAIEALRSEIAYREASNNMEYFVKIENWLEDAHYENSYEITDAPKKLDSSEDLGFESL